LSHYRDTRKDHPALVLGAHPGAHRAGQAAQPLPPLLLSLNSDDPVTFATSLVDEYAYLYFALLRRDLGANQALQVLDTLRENGWRSRFTLAASARATPLELIIRGTRSAGARRAGRAR
jgi:hypothetical protein